jgi:hypothetical protein
VTAKPKFYLPPGQRARPEDIPIQRAEGGEGIDPDITKIPFAIEEYHFRAVRRFRAVEEEDGGAYVEEAWLIEVAAETQAEADLPLDKLVASGLAEPWPPDGVVVATPITVAKLAEFAVENTKLAAEADAS